MEFLKPLILQVLTPECYDEFFLNMNFLHGKLSDNDLKLIVTGNHLIDIYVFYCKIS